MGKDGREQLQALFFKTSNLKNSRILIPQFNNVKPVLADEVLYGISPLGLLLFNILLHINPLSYILSSNFFTSLVFIFLTIFLFFQEYLFTFMLYPFFLFFGLVQLFTFSFIFLSSPLKFCVQKLETLTTTDGAYLSNRCLNLQTKFVLTSYRPARSA